MIKVDYLLICEDVTIDSNNRPTLVNIFDRLDVPKVPAGLKGAKLTFRFHPTTKAIVDQVMNIKVTAELNQKQIWKAEASPRVTVEKNNGYAQVLVVDPMIFPDYGNYWIKLYIDEKEMAKIIFIVKNSAELIEQ